MAGEVIDDANGKFRVKVNDNHIVLCTLSGKIRQNSIRILLGDSVVVEVSPYDMNMGRIVRRVRN
jgi:translation initiation factor IF-1